MGTVTILVIAAAALAAGAVLFYLTGRGGDAVPAEGSAFWKFGVKVRLRDLFRLSLLIEEKGEALYGRLGQVAMKPETKKLCAWLAEQEREHRRFAQDHLDRWRPLHPHLAEWPVFLEKVRKEGFFADPPGEGASEDELASYAISQEIKSAEFYAMFEGSFPDPWRKERMHRLVAEERSHERKLREAYPHIK